MTRALKGLLTAAVGLAALVSGPAAADPIVTSFTPTDTFVGGTFYLGYQFRADSNQSITQLGFYDDGLDGLASDHSVGLYALDGSLLGSVTVGAGATLIGAFRYATLSSAINLVAGASYRLAATTAGNDAWVFQGNSLVTNGVTYEGSYFRNDNSTAFPETPAPERQYYTVNAFAGRVEGGVPEPATWGMMIAGFAGLGVVLRRRREMGATVRFA